MVVMCWIPCFLHQSPHVPSFFLTMWRGEAQLLFESLTIPCCSMVRNSA